MRQLTTSVVLKLLNGMYQITQLRVATTPDGIALQSLTISALIYSENRLCTAVFYKKNKRNTIFYKEVEDDE